MSVLSWHGPLSGVSRNSISTLSHRSEVTETCPGRENQRILHSPDYVVHYIVGGICKNPQRPPPLIPEQRDVRMQSHEVAHRHWRAPRPTGNAARAGEQQDIPFGQKTQTHCSRGVYRPTIDNSLPCNPQCYSPYSLPLRGNNSG